MGYGERTEQGKIKVCIDPTFSYKSSMQFKNPTLTIITYAQMFLQHEK